MEQTIWKMFENVFEKTKYEKKYDLEKNESADLLFGNGQDSKFLHPSKMTYKSDFAVKSNDKYILLDKKIVVSSVPYFSSFNSLSGYKEHDIQKLVCSKSNDEIDVHIVEMLNIFQKLYN